MKVLFLGGTSYLGQEIIKRLTTVGGYDITVIRRETVDEQIKDIPQQDIVFNLVVDYGKNGKSFSEVMSANVNYPLYILEKVQFKTLINFSSGLAKDVSHYAFTKKMLEEALSYLALTSGWQIINLQLQHFFGPGAPAHNFISFLINKMKAHEAIPLTDCQQTRDFIFTEDLIDAVMMVIKNKDTLSADETIEIGSGSAVKLKELIELLKSLSNSRSDLIYGQIPKRKNEPMELKADITRIQSLGWRPKHDLKNGLLATLSGVQEI